MDKKRLLLVLIVLILLVVPMAIKYIPRGDAMTVDYHTELLYQWAPVIYQEIADDTSKKYLDKITSIDYDGDYNTANNWDNLEEFKEFLPSIVYAWSIETVDKYYLGYGLYHPRDWSPNPIGIVHENDFEGLILEIQKDNTWHGNLVSLLSIAHMDLLYLNSESIELDGTRPIVFVESGGHGVYGYNHSDREANTNYIKYIPNTGNEELTYENTTSVSTIKYDLSSIEWLWLERKNESLFTSSGFFESDRSGSCSKLDGQMCITNVAAPPWRWSQGQNFAGQIWFEPENVFDMFR